MASEVLFVHSLTASRLINLLGGRNMLSINITRRRMTRLIMHGGGEGKRCCLPAVGESSQTDAGRRELIHIWVLEDVPESDCLIGCACEDILSTWTFSEIEYSLRVTCERR